MAEGRLIEEGGYVSVACHPPVLSAGTYTLSVRPTGGILWEPSSGLGSAALSVVSRSAAFRVASGQATYVTLAGNDSIDSSRFEFDLDHDGDAQVFEAGVHC